jgi:ankyrin repeat protein
MGVLALKKACEFGRESVVKLVLDFWKEDRTALELNTCLCIATEYGQAKIVRLLVDAGADVNTTNSADNAQPLILAAGRGYEATVLELLGAKADVEARHNGTTALQALLDIGRSSIGATTSDSKGQTALHLAAEAGHAALVHELLKKGADKELASTLWDFRPLHCAAWSTPLLCIILALNPAD